MKFFRLESPRRDQVSEAFSGKGALYTAGRWNSMGNLAVYVSQSVSLAYLEKLAHLDATNYPTNLLLFEIEIPDTFVETRSAANLPDGWDMRPPGLVSRAIGDRWLKEKRSIALVVPSVIIVQEFNALLNPLHPKFDRKWVKGPSTFKHDTRLIPKPKGEVKILTMGKKKTKT